MSQTPAELKSALKLAAKAPAHKPHFFAMITKGTSEGTIIVDKRKIATKLIDEAKKDFSTTNVVKGLCFGDGDAIVFETARPPAGSLDSIAKRLAKDRAEGLSIKPEFRVGRDDEHVADDDADAPPEAPAESTPTQKSPAPQAHTAPEAPSAKGATKADDTASPEALAKKVYDGLLARLQPEVRAARDAKSSALPKLTTLLEFASSKAAAGEHRIAAQALQNVQALLDEAPKASPHPTATPTPTITTTPAPTATPTPKASEHAPEDKAPAFNAHFAALAAKIKQAAEDKSPSAAAAKSKAMEAAALAQKKDFDGATALVAEAEKLLGGTKPSSTARSRAPIEPDAAREFLAKVDASEDEDTVKAATANLLHDMKTALMSARRMVTVDSIDALAEAMATENGISKQAAREMIDNNQGRGFTGKSGTVYVLGNTPQAAHDEVHETVHLMSAPGGATHVMAKYGEQLNEALTEFFTKQMCAKLNVPDAVAYPAHVAFMNKLAPVVGYNTLFTAYMKNGGFDPVINKLTDIWIGKNDALPAPQKPPSTKGVITRAKVVEAMDKKFLNNFPPEGPALKFWDVVFFG